MSSDDDELIAVAHYNKTISEPTSKPTDSDDDVPIFNFNKTKPKLKSFGFVSKLSSLIKENQSEDEKPIVPTVMAPMPASLCIMNEKKKLPTLSKSNPLSLASNNVTRVEKRDRDTNIEEIKGDENNSPEKPEVAPAKRIRLEAPEEPKSFK